MGDGVGNVSALSVGFDGESRDKSVLCEALSKDDSIGFRTHQAASFPSSSTCYPLTLNCSHKVYVLDNYDCRCDLEISPRPNECAIPVLPTCLPRYIQLSSLSYSRAQESLTLPVNKVESLLSTSSFGLEI